MIHVRRGWAGAGIWSLAVVFSLVVLLAAMCRVTGAYEEESGHGVSDVGAVHNAGEGGGHDAGSHEGEGHHGLTHSQVMNFVWHCLNFSLLAFLLVKFLRKPITGALTGRTESIRSAFEELEAKRAEAERNYAEYERKLSNMDAEAERILKNFIDQGQVEKEKIIAQAHDAAERIKAQAEFYVDQELAKAKTELQSEVANMAVKMAEELIRKELNEQDHHRLISEYLERVVQKN